MYRKHWRPTQEEIDRARARGIKLLGMEGEDDDKQVVEAEGDDNDDDGEWYYYEEGEEEEALEEDAYMETESQNCVADRDLGRKLGIPEESLAPDSAAPSVPASASMPQIVALQASPQKQGSHVVANYLADAYWQSHLSPVKPRPNDRDDSSPESVRSPLPTMAPTVPTATPSVENPPPQPEKTEPMEAKAPDLRAERLARIAWLKTSDRVNTAFLRSFPQALNQTCGIRCYGFGRI